MSEVYSTKQNQHTIAGEYVDITIKDEANFAEYLEDHKGSLVLYEAHNQSLFDPIDAAYIRYSQTPYDDIYVHGHIAFTPNAAYYTDEIVSWQEAMSTSIEAAVPSQYQTYYLEHQLHDFYVQIDSVHVVYVKFDAVTDGCSIHLSLERASNIQYASRGDIQMYPDPDECQRPSSHHTVRIFSEIFSKAINTTISHYVGELADESLKKQIELSIPVKTLVPISRSEYNMPISEMETSCKDGFSKIGGLETAKQRLETLARLCNNREAAKLYGVSPSHFILYGPAGTGKTSLITAFANEINAELICINSTDVVDMWVGNSAKNLDKKFETAKKNPATQVLFFDEFETIAKKGSGGTSERVDVKKRLNQLLDQISENYPNIIVACATNADIDDLEPSLVRSGRIEPIGAPLPNEAERVDLWATILTSSYQSFDNSLNEIFNEGEPREANFVPYEDDINPIELAKATEGKTGADFKAILAAARKKQFTHHINTGEKLRVSQQDLLDQIASLGR